MIFLDVRAEYRIVSSTYLYYYICQKVTVHKERKIPFICNLKKPACASKWDVLELSTLHYSCWSLTYVDAYVLWTFGKKLISIIFTRVILATLWYMIKYVYVHILNASYWLSLTNQSSNCLCPKTNYFASYNMQSRLFKKLFLCWW